MSRPRSPHYRRFPWEEPDFDPHKVLAELDVDPMDRSHHRENYSDYAREDMFQAGQRRSSPFSDDRHFAHHRHPSQEEIYRRRPSPYHDTMGCDGQRLSPHPDREGDRFREGFRENFQSFESRERSPHSPLRLERNSLPPTPRSHSDRQQRDPGMGWRREEQGRDRGRFRDLSPSDRSEEHRAGAGRERERRNTPGSHRDRRGREDSHQERPPPFRRDRRDMDDGYHLG